MFSALLLAAVGVATGCTIGLVLCWRAGWRALGREANETVRKACLVLLAEDDRARESALRVLAGAVLRISLLVLLTSLALALVMLLPLANLGTGREGWTLTTITMAAALLVVSRRGKVKPTATSSVAPAAESYSYTWLEQLLHIVALEPRSVARASFALETTWHRKTLARPRSDAPVFVAGLARSGTTLVMRLLHATGEFASQSYADMPFVTAPVTWAKLSGSGNGNPSGSRERAHGDGVMVNSHSPEAFEEVFWATQLNRYRTRRAEPAAYDARVLQQFELYRSLVVEAAERRQGSVRPLRYLSKNNNNLLRLQALTRIPNARVLVPIREPLACAASLYRQHQRMSALQQADPFVRCYMRWLEHREFGLDHEPLGIALPHMMRKWTPDEPDYWLDYWIGTHEALQQSAGLRVVLVPHEWLVSEPWEASCALLREAEVGKPPDPTRSGQLPAVNYPSIRRPAYPHFQPDLSAQASDCYQQLLADSRCTKAVFRASL